MLLSKKVVFSSNRLKSVASKTAQRRDRDVNAALNILALGMQGLLVVQFS